GLISDGGGQASLEKACQVAERGGVLLAFAHLVKSDGGAGVRFGGRAVQLAAEVGCRLADSRPAIVPAHVFKPQAPTDSSAVLIHLEPPLNLDSAGATRPVADPERSRRADLPWQADDLLAAVDESLR